MKIDKIKSKLKKISAVHLFIVLLLVSAGVQAVNSGWTATSGTTFVTENGLRVTTSEDMNTSITNPTREKSVVLPGYGNVSSPLSANITIDQWTGANTQASSIDTGYGITINPDDKQRITVDGGITSMSFHNTTLNDGSSELSYSASSTGSITLYDLPANTWVAAKDGSTNLDAKQTNSTGGVDLSVPSGSHTVTMFSFTPHNPEVLNNTASYDKDHGVSKSPVNLSVGLRDADFANPTGENLNAVFYVDGSVVGSDQRSSNGTVSYTLSDSEVPTGGKHTWSVTVSDEQSNVVSSGFDLLMPSKLYIRSEQNASKVILNNTTAEVTFYTGNEVYNRNTSNGTIDMSGLPADESFVAVVNAPGYFPRRIYIPNLFTQQTVYLLPESAKSVNNSFVLKDYTGDYPKENTVLEIQRSINGSWQTVQGDYFGATGTYEAQLAYNTRYRLMLVNTKTGKDKNLGEITTLSSGTRVIEVKSDNNINIKQLGAVITVNPEVRTLPAAENTALSIGIESQNSTLTSYQISAVWSNSTANETLYTKTGSNPDGETLKPKLDLTNKTGQLTVVVNYTTDKGYSGSKTVIYRVSESFVNKFALLNILGGIGNHIPDANVGSFTSFSALLVTIFGTAMVGAKVRMSTEMIGGTAVAILGGFAIIGWVGYDLVFVAGVGLIVFAGLRRGL